MIDDIDERGSADDRLQALLTITDTALNRLSVDGLMREILERIRSILDVDTVTMLRRSEDRERLIAEATVGLEEEVRQGVTVPLGQGFAGTIATKAKAIVIDHVDADTVVNPLLWERGLRTMLGVPMLRDDRVMGVLHVGRTDQRAFTDVDIQLLSVAAERLVGAITADQLATEAAAARLLERSLLPSGFPRVPGAEFAGRYAAANRTIGGDWYDVFTLPDGTLWLVVGDVAGHGLRSAAMMGRVRTTLRAYALLGSDPAGVLELADRTLHHFEMAAMTTVLCAVSAPPYDKFEISAAGHLPPILATPGGETTVVPVESDVPLGSFPEWHRTSVTVPMALGAVLVLYTDGLVERPGESVDSGIEQVRTAVEADHPEVVCRTVMKRMVGADSPADDVALLTMRRTEIT